MIELEVTTEDCEQCGSQNIKLFTPNDESKYEYFYTECSDCGGHTIVVPQQGEIFIQKKGIMSRQVSDL